MCNQYTWCKVSPVYIAYLYHYTYLHFFARVDASGGENVRIQEYRVGGGVQV